MQFMDQLSKFLSEKYATEISQTSSLLETGLIDSIGLLDIIMFIEERTGVRIQDHEVTPDNFETIESINGLVTRLS